MTTARFLTRRAGPAMTTVTTTVVAVTTTVPIYCKVNGMLAPALNFELRLPDAWNGKLYYGGGGGYNGAIPALSVEALKQGYASVASDSGHQGSPLSASFALTDTFAAQLFGSLSVPTVMSTALETVTAAYGSPPTRSYFEGCSNGGREALMAVQRNPNLFDGVIARAPAYNWVGFMGAFNRTAKALAAPGGMFSTAKTALLAQHVRTACDGLDGLVDGVVSNAAACTPTVVNVAALRCAGGTDTGDTCLSDAQLAADASTRFYVAPGVNHCAGGPGADSADLLTALDQWVTKRVAPGTLSAQKLDAAGAVVLARPLCQHPQYPRYTGPANDAAAAKLASNYACTMP